MNPLPPVDLTVAAPRSPRVKLGGLYMLARTIDKVRAELQGRLGRYKVGPGLSEYLFEWLGISRAAFTAFVATGASDDDVVAWVRERSNPSTYEEINQRFATRVIRDAEHFAAVSPNYEILSKRPELRNWFEILDADDALLFSKPLAGR